MRKNKRLGVAWLSRLMKLERDNGVIVDNLTDFLGIHWLGLPREGSEFPVAVGITSSSYRQQPWTWQYP